MAKQAPLRSNTYLLWLFLALCNCHPPQREPTGPPALVSADVPGWQQRMGKLWLNNHPFSGRQYQCSASGDTLFVGTYLAGKADGLHWQWYASGQLKEVRRYQHGWQEGEQRGWYESGKPAFVYHFKNDRYEGNRKEWYANGQPALDGNYYEGQENGRQRQWFAEGNLKVNYAVRNGRHYGFTGVKNCVNVWDSIKVSP